MWKPFKNYVKCFLFYVKSYFRSRDNYIFVLTFSPELCGNCAFPQNLYPRKLGETAVFSAVKATVKTFDITDCVTNNRNAKLTNISRSNCNQVMKFGQLRNIIWEKFSSKVTEKTRQKDQLKYMVKASGQQLNFSIFY